MTAPAEDPRHAWARGPSRGALLVAGPLAGIAGVTWAAASVLASRVVGVRHRRRYDQRLLAVEGDVAMLGRNEETVRPGRYGLASPQAHAVVGDVASLTGQVVVRPIERFDYGALEPGPVALGHVHVGDPRTALDLDFADIDLPGETGPLPAWVVPGKPAASGRHGGVGGEAGDGDTWVVFVHGLGGSRAGALSFLPAVHAAGHTALVVSYRNDPEAGSSTDGCQHLGDEEWRDVDVAMAHALARGARRLVLFGWSLGGAIALQAVARSPRAPAVVGLVLDSPVVDWRRVLHHAGRRSRVPPPLVHLAIHLVERRIGIDLDAFDWLDRHEDLSVPVLAFHGATDPVVPYEPTAELARLREDLVDLVVVPGAGHVGSWNVDPTSYGARVTRFIDACTRAPAGRPAPSMG